MMKVKVVRDEILIEIVYFFVKNVNNKKIGYMEIMLFFELMGDEFMKQLKKFENKNIDGLVLDVWGNFGGYLMSVEKMFDKLVMNKKLYI